MGQRSSPTRSTQVRTTAPMVGDLAGLVPAFGRHLRAANRSPATLAAYVGTAEAFAAFLAERGMPSDVAAIRREHIETYIEDVLTTGKPATASFRYRSLQQLFKWLVDEGEITENPMERMKPPIVPEQPVPVVPEAHLKKLL